MKQNLLGLTNIQLTEFFLSLEEKNYRTKQLMQWLYKKNVLNFATMTNLSKKLVAKLEQIATLNIPSVFNVKTSIDGTIKWLIDLGGKNLIETVYIPQNNRGTLCISSQIGCALNCSFCATGNMGFSRNLSSSEIIAQVLIAKNYLRDTKNSINNIVFMGMGEPLFK